MGWSGKNRPQVFINFRGEDERLKLLPHLKHHLKDSNVNVFTDDDAIGEPLENIFKHIRRSRIVIVIFSINYLESRWCLDELVEITKCLETEKLDFAIPIFYKVKTSHVKKQSGKFGKKFVDLQKKHRNSRVKRWKKALRYVAGSIGLPYQKRSSISELDFIKKIVERVEFTLTKIELKDKRNNNNDTSEMSEGESSIVTEVHHSNKMLHPSTTLEALKLERSYLQGFMVGSAWKDGITSSMPSSSNSFTSSHPPNPLQFGGNNWVSISVFVSVSLEVLSLFCFIVSFSLFDKYKICMLMDMTPQGVDSRPFLSTNSARLPQDYRQSISYHNDINQYHPWSYETGFHQYTPPRRVRLVRPMSYDAKPEKIMDWSSSFDQYPATESTRMQCDTVSTSDAVEREDKTSCISFFHECFKRCFSLTRGAKEDEED